MTQDAIKSVKAWPFRSGGVPHSGWLPPGAATPKPTPVVHHRLDAAIVRVGEGWILEWSSADDTSFFGDNFYEQLEGAERAAAEMFGIHPSDWVA